MKRHVEIECRKVSAKAADSTEIRDLIVVTKKAERT